MKKTLLLAAIFISYYGYSQKNAIKTETITVKGNCEQCKKRIENAADLKGVKVSNWNEETKVLSVTYNPDKINLQQIMQAVAKSGHDAGNEQASDAAYKKLPGCCQYKDRACEEKKK